MENIKIYSYIKNIKIYSYVLVMSGIYINFAEYFRQQLTR